MEEYIIAGAVIIGIVNGIQLGFPQVKGFVSFLISLALGILFGAIHFFGLPGIEAGIITALASSGLYKVATRIGGQ